MDETMIVQCGKCGREVFYDSTSAQSYRVPLRDVVAESTLCPEGGRHESVVLPGVGSVAVCPDVAACDPETVCGWCGEVAALCADGGDVCESCWHRTDWHRGCDPGDGPTVCPFCGDVLATHDHGRLVGEVDSVASGEVAEASWPSDGGGTVWLSRVGSALCVDWTDGHRLVATGTVSTVALAVGLVQAMCAGETVR